MSVVVRGVPQGSDTWQALRHGRITATRLGDALGVGFNGPERAMRALSAGDEVFSSLDIERGHRLEPFILDVYEGATGHELDRGVTIGLHPRLPFVAASPDALTERLCVDAKAPRRLKGEVRRGYLVQLAVQMAVFDRAAARLVCYSEQDDDLECFEVYRDPVFERDILAFASFWYSMFVMQATAEATPDTFVSGLKEAAKAARSSIAWPKPRQIALSGWKESARSARDRRAAEKTPPGGKPIVSL